MSSAVQQIGPWHVGQRVVSGRAVGQLAAFNGAAGTVKRIDKLGDDWLRLWVDYPGQRHLYPAPVDYLLRVDEEQSFVSPL